MGKSGTARLAVKVVAQQQLKALVLLVPGWQLEALVLLVPG